jgi:hypothetical protein
MQGAQIHLLSAECEMDRFCVRCAKNFDEAEFRTEHRRANEIASAAITGEPGRLAPQLFAALPANEKHQMGMPAHVAIASVLLIRHHVAHRSTLQRGQFFPVQCR